MNLVIGERVRHDEFAREVKAVKNYMSHFYKE